VFGLAGVITFGGSAQLVKWKEMMAEDMRQERLFLQQEVTSMENTPGSPAPIPLPMSKQEIASAGGVSSAKMSGREKAEDQRDVQPAGAESAAIEPAAAPRSIWDWLPIRPATEEDIENLPVLGRPNHNRPEHHGRQNE
jgi:hypothetical protein